MDRRRPHEPSGTVITVAGEMTASLRDEFDDLEVTVGHSVTHLRVADADTSVLHGLIHRIELLGLELLDVRRDDHLPRSPGPR